MNGEQPDQVCLFRKLGCRVGDKLERRRENAQNPLRGKLNSVIESRVTRVTFSDGEKQNTEMLWRWN